MHQWMCQFFVVRGGRFSRPSDLRARAVEFQMFDGGRAADVFSPKPLLVRRRGKVRPRCNGDPRGIRRLTSLVWTSQMWILPREVPT